MTKGPDPTFAEVLVQESPDALLALSAEGKVLYWNAGASALFGFTRDEAIGRSLDEMIVPEDRRDEARRALAESIEKGPTVAFETVRSKKDGTRIDVDVTMRGVKDDTGSLRFIAVTAIRDVTDRRRAVEERAKLNEAQEALRMRDEFLSIACHELKTPLSAMQLRVQSSLRLAPVAGDSTVPPVLVELPKIRSIQNAVTQLNALVSQLMDVSRITSKRLELHKEDVDLVTLVREAAADSRDEMGRVGSELRIEADGPIRVPCDAMRIGQVVTNLVSNATKYGGGKPVEILLSATVSHAEITVRDHGIGIARDQQERLFDRFERIVSERDYGVGLGLWIVRHILDAHGASIRVWSEPGAGSVFTVSIPFAKGSNLETVRRIDVLVVDDDANFRETISDTLKSEGFVVESDANGREALARLHRGLVPRIVLLDLMMPVMDGVAFRAEQLRDKALADIPLALMSASAKLTTEAEALRVTGYLRKPVDLEELLRVIRTHATAPAVALPPS